MYFIHLENAIVESDDHPGTLLCAITQHLYVCVYTLGDYFLKRIYDTLGQ